jgi:hypothetical protein
MAISVRAVVPALVLVALVALAGCSGTSPAATTPATDPVETTTPATDASATQTTASSASTTDSRSGDDTPPGIAEGTVTDAFALTDAHADAVANESHVVVETRSLAYANGTTFLNASTTIAVAENPDVYFVESTRTGASVVDRETSLYANGSIVARHPAENASYSVVHTPAGEPVTPASTYPGVPRNVDSVALLLESSEETTATPVGAETYRITATGASPDALDISAVALDNASNVTLDLYVTETGRILNYTVSFDATRNDSALAGEIRVAYAAIGETAVETPTWFHGNATAENATRSPLP